MSREAWGDEGIVPQHGRDTASFQEMNTIRNNLHKWISDFRSELNPDEFREAMEALGRIDDVIDRLNVPL